MQETKNFTGLRQLPILKHRHDTICLIMLAERWRKATLAACKAPALGYAAMGRILLIPRKSSRYH
jgi:hypothetical protein